MQAILPLVYLAAGWLLARSGGDWRSLASRLLSVVVIPTVIVLHVVGTDSRLALVMVSAVVWMLLMLALGSASSRDPVEKLCFGYLNIGWLGLPVAAAALDRSAVGVVTTFYVTSSILGNTLGPAWLRRSAPTAPADRAGSDGSRLARPWRDAARTPSLRALVAGLCLRPLGPWLAQHASWLAHGATFLLGMLGMMILGSWLAHAPLRAADLWRALPRSALRAALSVLVLGTIGAAGALGGAPAMRITPAVVVLLSILPPAANIVVLETAALRTGRSAPLIAAGTVWSLAAIALYMAYAIL